MYNKSFISGFGGINLEISDDTDVVNLFNALAKMDLMPLNQNDGRNRRATESSLLSLNSAIMGCAMIFVAIGFIISRKRPAYMRSTDRARNNRHEGSFNL